MIQTWLKKGILYPSFNWVAIKRRYWVWKHHWNMMSFNLLSKFKSELKIICKIHSCYIEKEMECKIGWIESDKNIASIFKSREQKIESFRELDTHFRHFKYAFFCGIIKSTLGKLSVNYSRPQKWLLHVFYFYCR